jgi:hypothetical protein
MDKETIIQLMAEAGLKPPARGDFIFIHWDQIALLLAHEREACAKKVGEFAQQWWSIHCDSNKHMETTRKAHDDFCALQSAIRARGQA